MRMIQVKLKIKITISKNVHPYPKLMKNSETENLILLSIFNVYLYILNNKKTDANV